jgi:L-iditol 2-dehydrogenase
MTITATEQEDTRTMDAHQLVSRTVGQIALEPYDLSDSAPAGGILVKASASLISPGTEIANFLGNTTQRTPHTTEPYIPGYSFAGTVIDAAEGAGFAVGDRICGPLPHASYADENRPERLVRMSRIPDGVSDAEASVTQLACISLNAVRAAEIQPGHRVIVIGAGLVGLLAARLAQISGARPVIVQDLMPERRTLARAFGFENTFDPNDPALAERLEDIAPGGFDIVIEATGSPRAFVPALKLAARGGRVVLLGSTRGTVEGFSPYDDIHLKGLTVVGAHVSTSPKQGTPHDKWTEAENRRYILELMRDKVLDVAPLITHVVPPAEAADAFTGLADRPAEYLGVVIDWTLA